MLQEFAQLNYSRDMFEAFFVQLALTWGSRLFKVLVIVVLARLALRFGYRIIDGLLTPKPERPHLLPEKKARTISVLLLSFWRYFIYALTIVLVLTELDILEIGPILAGAGIVGLAVGFGAQSLVRDIISGFFIILEDQFSVGDFITTGQYSGIVEELGLRITKIRDFSGEVHIIPNGQIDVVTNRSQGSMRALVEVGVAYEEDVDRVLSVLADMSRAFAEDNPDVVEGPTVLGVVELADSAVVIRLIARTVPMAQWKVERDLLRMIKQTFDREGIEIPYPRRVVFTRAGEKGEK